MKGRFLVTVLVFAAAGAMAAGGGAGGGGEMTTDIYQDDAAGSLTVNNRTNEPLVLFAGVPRDPYFLGGVRALSSRRIDFFDKVEGSGAFLLRAVKERVYRSKGSPLDSDDVIFAGLVVYDKEAVQAARIDIDEIAGGEAYFIARNETNMALQLRVNHPDGPILTTLAPLERMKKVYTDVTPGGYMLFPEYQYYDRASMSIRSIPAQSFADGIMIMPDIPRPGSYLPIVNFDAVNLPFATLVVANETNRSMYLLEDSVRKMSQRGLTLFHPGLETFELNLQKRSVLSIDLSLGAANVIPIPAYDYEAGYSYQVRVRQGAVPEIIRLGKLNTDGLSIELANEQ
jgi:hypothetical protein